MLAQKSATSVARLTAILFIAAPILTGHSARAQSNKMYQVGDACQSTQTVQACQALAKSFKYATGLYVGVATSIEFASAGVSHGQPTQSAAEQTALANCNALGASDCEVTVHAQNSCVGVVVNYIQINSMMSKTLYYYGYSSSRYDAGEQAIAACRKSSKGAMCSLLAVPCSTDNPAYPARLPQPSGGNPGAVDPNLVGTWEIDIPTPNSGRWLWQVTANGTYELHSEAFDGTPTNSGTIFAQGGHYTLGAGNIAWDDSGTYTFQPPATLVATGKLGTGVWHKIDQDDE